MIIDNFIQIDGISVYIKAIASITHKCNPQICINSYCCYNCEIVINNKELETIISYLPFASNYVKDLRLSDGYLNFFDKLKTDKFIIDLNKDDYCIFSYSDRQGTRLCSIHTAAIENCDNPYLIKPFICKMWPLIFIKRPKKVLSVADDALLFPCNTERDMNLVGFDLLIGSKIKCVFGDTFFEKLEKAKKDLLDLTK